MQGVRSGPDGWRVEGLTPLDATWYQMSDLYAESARGDVQAGLDGIVAMETLVQSSDRQLHTISLQARARSLLLVGKPEAALVDLRAVKEQVDFQQDSIFLMARTAFALMDAEIAQEAVSLRDQAFPSPWGRVMVATAEGVLAALEGNPNESAAHFEKALRTPVASPLSRALIHAMYGSLVCTDVPAARAAGDEAYRWFVETGSLGYLALFPAIMPTDEHIANIS